MKRNDNLLKEIIKKLFHFFNLEITRIRKKETEDNKEPKQYTALLNGWVPCQIESYFLALNKYVNQNDRILDVGFGMGFGLIILAIKAGVVNGIDIDTIALDYCKNVIVDRIPKLNYLNTYDGYNIDFPDNYFDIVTCVDVIEHVEDYERLIREMLRVSKKGIFINTPNRRPEYTGKDGKPLNHWHLREWSFEEFDNIIRKFGDIDWNFLNGSWNGPFELSCEVTKDSLTLTPFIKK